MNKSDGKVHSEYLFQNGNADGFVRTLQTTHCLQRSRHNKNQFEIVDNIEYDKEKLQKTFAELKIDDIKAGKGGWISNIVGNPLEQTIDFLAKMSDVYTIASTSTQSSPVKSDPNNSTTSLASNNDEYEVLSNSPRDQFKLPIRPSVVRSMSLSPKQWSEFMTEDGRISDAERVKEVIFRGGIENSIRVEVWKYLLNYYDWDMTTEQRIQHRNRKSQEYYQMKMQWLSKTQIQEKNFADYRDRKCQIEKDVKRTDRTQEYFAGDDNPNLGVLQDILMTYVMYNFDLGYVQGMSDLLAPILCIMKNESDAFWCFVGFMDIVYTNFDMDQAGMKRQLQELNKLISIANPRLYSYFKEHKSENMYFCFRWLLVWFKREFTNEDIYELWEVLWTGLPCMNFHLFVSVAILDDQQDIFIDRKYEFNEILKHVNELSLAIDLKSTLEKAEAIYLQIKTMENINDEIRKIIGEEPIEQEKIDDDYDENFDEIVTISKNAKEEIEIQKKIDEACERSMYNSFY